MTSDRLPGHMTANKLLDQRRDVVAVSVAVGSQGALRQPPDARILPSTFMPGPDRNCVRLQTAVLTFPRPRRRNGRGRSMPIGLAGGAV